MNSFCSMFGSDDTGWNRMKHILGVEIDNDWSDIIKFRKIYHTLGNFLLIPNRKNVNRVKGTSGRLTDSFETLLSNAYMYYNEKENGTNKLIMCGYRKVFEENIEYKNTYNEDFLFKLKYFICKIIIIMKESQQSSLNLVSEGKKGLADYVSTNLNTDEYYTRSHLQKLDIIQTVGSASWLGIINDKDLFQESLDWFRGYINFICEKIGYELLYQMIDNCRSINENKDSQLEASLCYGTCMYICSFIEKILKIIYIELKREIEYIPIENITLGELLSDGNSLYAEMLGEYQLKHLRYFLLTDGDKKIGTNYRNSLAHYSSITSENINMFLVGKLMFLFTNIITSFFHYFFMKQSEENIDN
ncbi:MAG: hypothetical protein E7249_02080 [Paenibacillaceae bacterium]|nr:hypothetical protein [Paenibacillaceae bacterium]